MAEFNHEQAKASGTRLSTKTVQRTLVDIGIHEEIPRSASAITLAQKKCRLHFATKWKHFDFQRIDEYFVL